MDEPAPQLTPPSPGTATEAAVEEETQAPVPALEDDSAAAATAGTDAAGGAGAGAEADEDVAAGDASAAVGASAASPAANVLVLEPAADGAGKGEVTGEGAGGESGGPGERQLSGGASLLDLGAESSDLLEGSPCKAAAEEAAEQAAVEKVEGSIKALRLGAGAGKVDGPAAAAHPAHKQGKEGVGVAAIRKLATQVRLSHPRLSFSAPPKIPRPKTAVRHNYSHSPQRVRQILHDNEALVKRLSEITYSGSSFDAGMAKHEQAMRAAAAKNAARRRSEAAQVVRQNLDIYRRLQAIKPSREVSRTEHRKSFEVSRKHAANASRYRWAPEEAWVDPKVPKRRDPDVWSQPDD